MSNIQEMAVHAALKAYLHDDYERDYSLEELAENRGAMTRALEAAAAVYRPWALLAGTLHVGFDPARVQCPTCNDTRQVVPMPDGPVPAPSEPRASVPEGAPATVPCPACRKGASDA